MTSTHRIGAVLVLGLLLSGNRTFAQTDGGSAGEVIDDRRLERPEKDPLDASSFPGTLNRGLSEAELGIPEGFELIEGDVVVPIGQRGTTAVNLWTAYGLGVIPYEFDGNVSASNQQRAIDAMADWEARSGVNFIQRAGHANYIHIFSGTGNWSYVGMIGGRQDISIFNWSYRFIIDHELAHAMGYWHEQSRPDRESFVQINWGNIQSGREHNFDIHPEAGTVGTYDFDSVMHYSQFAFSSNGQPTITVLPPNEAWQSLIGQVDHLSDGDAATAAALYGAIPPGEDCNGNGLRDSFEIATGADSDCDGNTVPDSCQVISEGDCNGNGVPDVCDAAGGGPPADSCTLAPAICPGATFGGSTSGASGDGAVTCGSSSFCPDVWYSYSPTQSGTATVSLCGSSYDTVLSVHSACPGTTGNQIACNDDFCSLQSEVSWSATAGATYLVRISGYSCNTGNFTLQLTGPTCELVDNDCNTNGIPDDCDISSGFSDDCDSNNLPDDCQPDCNANLVADACELVGNDCNGDGIPDDCSGDCNVNLIPDVCDIFTGAIPDCDSNGIPDDCQPDCNSNGAADPCDISSATSTDLNANGVPDDCEDCNGNAIPDDLDIDSGFSLDCNTNGTPDECEPDCDANGVPDSCALAATSMDCNTNGIPDECDIADGILTDANTNGVGDNFEFRIYVDASAAGLNNGSSWTDAYVELQSGLAAAASIPCGLTELWVANGTYLPDGGYTPAGGVHVPGSGLRAPTFQLLDNVELYGGFAGTEALLSERLPDPDRSTLNPLVDSVLSGDLDGNDILDNQNSYNVLTGTGVSASGILDGFSVTHGNANVFTDNSLIDCAGAGLQIESGSPTVRNCVFSGNSAGFPVEATCGAGGGISIRGGGTPQILDCMFRQNVATTNAAGGGVFVSGTGTNPVFRRCEFIDNTAFQGGGLYVAGSSPIVEECIFTDNSVIGGEGSRGGGMASTGNSNASITGCTFTGNSAPESTFGGGGMSNDVGSNPTVTDCTFINNSAAANGGGMHNDTSASPTLTDCTFVGNTAGDDNGGGGGIATVSSSTTTLVDCSFVANEATGMAPADPNARPGGGAIYAANSQVIATNCSFASNTASANGDGGAVRVFDGSSASFTNCVFAGNESGVHGGAINMTCCMLPNDVTIANCTISGNTAASAAGGVHNGMGELSITNSILWGDSLQEVFLSGSTGNVSSSDLEGGQGGVFSNGGTLNWLAGNIAADPQFIGGPSGSWTANATYDPATGQTTLTDSGAGFTVDELAGTFLNPNTTQFLQTLIVSNTATEIVVWGDFSAEGVTGAAYQINDYHLRPLSPAIDAGTNSVVPEWLAASGGNGHAYQLMRAPQTSWDQAREIAATFWGNRSSHLAAITASEEQLFLNGLLDSTGIFYDVDITEIWIGGFQPEGTPEPDSGWEWITGEPWSWTNWSQFPSPAGQPNNSGGEEDLLSIWGPSLTANPEIDLGDWVDQDYPGVLDPNGLAFLVEFPDGAIDLDANPRVVDIPGFNGSTAIVDMGAYERQIPDCNTNGVDDGTDIAGGTSEDCNTNSIPDECEVSPVVETSEFQLLVSSSNTGSVFSYGADGTVLGAFATSAGTTLGMEFGPDGNLYVTKTSVAGRVDRFLGGNGALIDTFVPSGSEGLGQAFDLTFGPDDDLYVLDRTNATVHQYNGTTGAFVRVFVTSGSGGLATANGLVFGPDGNLYVANNTDPAVDGNVLRYSGLDGTFMDEFTGDVPGCPGDTSLCLAVPFDLTFGPDGNLYVLSNGNDTVLRYDGQTGTYFDRFVDAPSGGLIAPQGVAFGPDGNLYVADWNDAQGLVRRYNGVTGIYIDEVVPPGAGGLGDANNLLFLVDCNNNGIPDECEEDLNTNGVPDECETASFDTIWTGLGDGLNWEDPANWLPLRVPDNLPGNVPPESYLVTIGGPGSFEVDSCPDADCPAGTELESLTIGGDDALNTTALLLGETLTTSLGTSINAFGEIQLDENGASLGGGPVTIAAEGVLNANSGVAFGSILVPADVDNAGLINVSSLQGLTLGTGLAGNSFSNQPSGSLVNGSGAGTIVSADTVSQAGLIDMTGGSTLTFSNASLVNQSGATIDMTNATLDCPLGLQNEAGGTITGNGLANTIVGNVVNEGNIVFDFQSGSLLTIDGTLASTAGGVLGLDAPMGMGGGTLSGTAVEVSNWGRLELSGPADLSLSQGLTIDSGGVLEPTDISDALIDVLDVNIGSSTAVGGRLKLDHQMELIVGGDVVISDGPCADGSGFRGCSPPELAVSGDATVAVGGSITVGEFTGMLLDSSMPVQLAGDFDNQSQDNYRFDMDSGTLLMNGLLPQSFEVAGEDVGALPTGLQNNFAIGVLDIDASSEVTFSDLSDNDGLAQSPCGEALYVDTLVLGSGSTITLDNVRIYYQTLIDLGANSPSLVGCGELVQLGGCSTVAARSCSDHGAANRICLDMMGASTIEPRLSGITSVELDLDSGSATSAVVSCINNGAYGGVATVSQLGSTVTVDLSPALQDGDACTITLDCGASACVRGLAGDIDRNGIVSTGDASIIKPHFGQDATTAGAEFDFDQNDIVSTGDASIVKPLFGNTGPACP